MVDAIIRGSKGNYPLEVVSDHEVPYVRQAAALEQYGQFLQVPGIRNSWHMTLTRRARIRHIHEELPSLLLAMDPQLPDEMDGTHVPRAFRDLGIRRMSKMSVEPVGWNVILSQGGWSGSAGTDELGNWISNVLAAQMDVAAKLARYGGVERHAFIWATVGSRFGAQLALTESWLPVIPPRLPVEITHVWAGGLMSDQGCFYWSPVAGWVRTDWSWRPERPANQSP